MCAGARDYAIGYCTAGDHRKSTVFGVTGSFHMKMFAAFATRRRPSPFAWRSDSYLSSVVSPRLTTTDGKSLSTMARIVAGPVAPELQQWWLSRHADIRSNMGLRPVHIVHAKVSVCGERSRVVNAEICEGSWSYWKWSDLTENVRRAATSHDFSNRTDRCSFEFGRALRCKARRAAHRSWITHGGFVWNRSIRQK